MTILIVLLIAAAFINAAVTCASRKPPWPVVALYWILVAAYWAERL